MLDEHIERFRKEQPAWDDLRERRLLRGIRRTVDDRRARRWTRRRSILIATPTVIAIAAMVIAYVTGVDFGKRHAVQSSPPAAPNATAESAPRLTSSAGEPQQSPEVRVLADGSRLELTASARVEVSAETPGRVELAQSGGRVRYEVAHVPARAFVVRAEDVRIEVTGTVFVVSFEGDAISIQVDAGRVRVSGPGKEAELGPGDELRMASQSSPAADGPRPHSAGRGDGAALASPAALLERADAERAAGDLGAAAKTLRDFVGRYPNDARSALAWFTLGKVERARAHPVAAARAFRMSGSLAPVGPLAEDALAEEAASWADAQDGAKARAAVDRYLRRFPNGTHAARMRSLLE